MTNGSKAFFQNIETSSQSIPITHVPAHLSAADKRTYWKIHEHLCCNSPYSKDDEVDGRVYETSSNFGVFIAVDDKYSALLPKKEVFETYRINQPVHARVTQVLEDGKLSLSVKKKIPEQMNEDASFILSRLENSQGFLPFNDKSTPDDIKQHFHMSKNAFKRAIGHLLKEKLITIEKDGIHII